jgi:hypothetical protein
MAAVEAVSGYVRGQIPDETFKKRRHEIERSLEKVASQLEGANVHLNSGHTGNNIVNFATQYDGKSVEECIARQACQCVSPIG